MKKIIFSFGLLFLFVSISVHAQSSGMKYINAQLDSNKLSEANADLSQVDIDFCDKPGEKTIDYTVVQGGLQDICMKATNASDKDIAVNIGFVDGTVTNDQRKNKACMQQGDTKNFGQYVTGFESSFTIPANGSIEKHAELQLPASSKGIINGCLIFYTKSVAMGGQLNFSVLMRKAKFIDIQVRENSFIRKNIFRILIILLMMYYAKIFVFSKKPKKLPK